MNYKPLIWTLVGLTMAVGLVATIAMHGQAKPTYAEMSAVADRLAVQVYQNRGEWAGEQPTDVSCIVGVDPNQYFCDLTSPVDGKYPSEVTWDGEDDRAYHLASDRWWWKYSN